MTERTFTFTAGTSETQNAWPDRRSATWPELAALLTKHERGPKEGPCIVPATFRGTRRTAADAERIDLVVLDADCGHTLDEIEAALQANGWAAIVHSTHSHLTTRTRAKVSHWQKFRDACPIDAERVFLIEEKGYLPRVAAGARLGSVDDDYAHFEHAPCPKFRIILRLSRPWQAADYPSQAVANAAWKERIEALAAALKLSHDQSCTDTSRLFYLPRHPGDGREPVATVIDGTDCDIWSLPKSTKSEQPGGMFETRRTTTDDAGEFTDPETGECVDLRKWAREYGQQFEIVNALQSRRPGVFVGHITESTQHHIRCVNEDAHTDAGADRATIVVNASAARNKGFAYHCRHAHCTGHDRLFFIRRMLAEGWLKVDDLSDPAFLAARESAGKDQTAETADRPLIQVKPGQLDVMADAAELALLRARADVFQRADHLVRPGFSEVPAADDRSTIAAGLHAIATPALREELSRVSHWQKFDGRSRSWQTIDPPALVASVLDARKGRWRLRPCTGVITCPTLRPDCSILTAAGYDAPTRLFHMPEPNLVVPHVPDSPTRSDAEAALALLKGLLTEFPFVTAIDRAVALSLIVSTVARGALGMVPVHAFTAPAPGSGKSFLSDVTTAIVSGRLCPVITAGKTEEELEKRLGAMLLSGYQVISIDNMSNGLSGDALCQIAERPTVRIRILGKSETPECEFRGIIIANGNNLVIVGDMTRRVLLGKLDAGVERPETRTFTFDPVQRVLADRGSYVAAAMTIVKAYVAAGMPAKLSPLASYGAWSDRVRSALVWLGCGDPVATMEETRDSDPILTSLRSTLHAWRNAFGDEGLTSQEIAAKFAGYDPHSTDGMALTALRAALAPNAGVRGVIDATRLGYWLRKSKGRPVNGLKIISESAHGGVAAWRVVPVNNPA